MKKSLIALAFGTLGLGITEFVMMGILPDVAAWMGVSIAKAGQLISAYAIGVCVGAPMLVLARKFPLKNILLVLVGVMIAGMTIANLFGVPLGTSLSHTISWRIPFLLVTVWGVLTLFYIWKWVPQVEGLPDTGFRGQFRFLKNPAPWLIIGATMFGNGSVFCWYSYINPLLTDVSGFSAGSISLLMILAGAGMVVAIWPADDSPTATRRGAWRWSRRERSSSCCSRSSSVPAYGGCRLC